MVTVHRIELVSWEPPAVTFRATVSPGTYLRAIGRDLGERLGVGGHLTALRREAIGRLRVEEAVSLEEVTAEALRPPARVLGHLPAVELDPAAKAAVVHGRAVADGGAMMDPDVPVVLLAGEELVAVARSEEGRLQPTVVLATP
jgi:tRNA pseudouridine55 synthase